MAGDAAVLPLLDRFVAAEIQDSTSISSAPAEQLTAAEAWTLLRVRWQIELLFKLWKQPDQVERAVRALAERERLEQLLGDLIAAVGRAGRQTRRKTTLGTWQLLGGAPTSLT